MSTYNRILFVADRTTAENTNALERAAELAAADGAKISIFDTVEMVSTDDPSLTTLVDEMQTRMISDRIEELEGVAGQINGLDADIRVVPGKDIVAITAAVLEGGYDLEGLAASAEKLAASMLEA